MCVQIFPGLVGAAPADLVETSRCRDSHLYTFIQRLVSSSAVTRPRLFFVVAELSSCWFSDGAVFNMTA